MQGERKRRASKHAHQHRTAKQRHQKKKEKKNPTEEAGDTQLEDPALIKLLELPLLLLVLLWCSGPGASSITSSSLSRPKAPMGC